MEVSGLVSSVTGRAHWLPLRPSSSAYSSAQRFQAGFARCFLRAGASDFTITMASVSAWESPVAVQSRSVFYCRGAFVRIQTMAFSLAASWRHYMLMKAECLRRRLHVYVGFNWKTGRSWFPSRALESLESGLYSDRAGDATRS